MWLTVHIVIKKPLHNQHYNKRKNVVGGIIMRNKSLIFCFVSPYAIFKSLFFPQSK